MNIVQHIKDLYLEALRAATVTLESDPGIHLSIWGSWSACNRAQLDALAAAGCQEVILNVNTVQGGGQRWLWQNSREAVLGRAQRIVEAGMTVAWMPWMWAYSEFGKMAGENLRLLDEDLKARTGQGARMVQLDWEGHAEVSAKRLVASSGQTMGQVVDRCLSAMCAELPQGIALGITPLYFRRPAGDAAIRWEREIDGRLWSIRELLAQAYSVWLQGSSAKARATHAPEYQPGRLQERAWANYEGFDDPPPEHEASGSWASYVGSRPYLDRVGIGLNGWALRREGPGVPDRLELSAEEAMDRAVEAVLEVGADSAAFWALHLFDSGRGVEQQRFELVCEALRRLSGEGPRVDRKARTPTPEPEPAPGVTIHWDRRRSVPTLAQGGAPRGGVLPQMVGVPLAAVVPPAKAIAARARAEGWEVGQVVPIVVRGRKMDAVWQRHDWTPDGKGGRKAFGGPGVTVYARRA